MPGGIRPDKRLNKLLYKLIKTPKSLQQDTKDISVKLAKAWNQDNPPASTGNPGSGTLE